MFFRSCFGISGRKLRRKSQLFDSTFSELMGSLADSATLGLSDCNPVGIACSRGIVFSQHKTAGPNDWPRTLRLATLFFLFRLNRAGRHAAIIRRRRVRGIAAPAFVWR